MNGPDVLRVARRFVAIAVVVAAIAGLVRIAIDEGPDGERVSYPQTVAVVALIAVTGWALLAARATLRGQEPAEIELLPRQPGSVRQAGDARLAGEADASKPAGPPLSDRELLAVAPPELDRLRKRVVAAVASREAYDERLAPALRELAEARAAHAGRRIDVDARVDIGPYLPGDPASCLLMRLPAYRRKVLTRAVGAVTENIEEID